MKTSELYNPVKDINEYFGVSDLKQIVNTEKFKQICPPDSISFHVNVESSGMTYLWFEDEKGFTGYGLDNGELKPYISRASIFLDGCNSLKQRHATLRNLMRASKREKDQLRESNNRLLDALKQVYNAHTTDEHKYARMSAENVLRKINEL